jgi:regulator of cell morphogenesis and NO signaling
MMELISTKTIREIALEAPATTRVFEEYKIDYCCGGRKSLADACMEAGLNLDLVSDKVEKAMVGNDRIPEQRQWRSPSLLVNHIIATHHIFTAQEIERLKPLMEKVCSRHGENHPELFKLQTMFSALTDSLIPHMRKEEMVLFPYIQSLESSVSKNGPIQPAHFGTVENPIRMMTTDHEIDGERLRVMREIANDYVTPAGACPSFTALYAGLNDLDRDLHQHIHLENNILFPAAVELERQAFAAV